MQWSAYGVLGFVLLLSATDSARSADHSGDVVKRVETEMVPPLVEAIAQLGRGELDKALDQFETLIGRKFRTGKGPFANSERAKWQNTFVVLATNKPTFETVDLIGIEPISSQSCKISLMGNGSSGPVLFQCRAYLYRGNLRLATVRFDMSWERIEILVSRIEKRMKRSYPVKAAEAAKR